MGGYENYGPLLGPYYDNLGYPKRDHNFDNHPYAYRIPFRAMGSLQQPDSWFLGAGFRV